MAKSTRKTRAKGPTLIQQSRRVPDEQKALYHQVLGAGKSRVKRPFLGLTDADEEAITRQVLSKMDALLATQTRGR